MFDAPPEAFGSYRVIETVGAGRFGPVFRAREETTGLAAAVKVIDHGFTPDQAARLVAALESLSKAPLNHPAIVPVLAAGSHDEHVWVAEPWFDVIPLDEVMRRDGALPVPDVLVRVTQVGAALDFAAAVGVHHGALHPRDILLDENHTVVAGLGFVQALSEAGLIVPIEGAYVSPQRAQGMALSASDDIFSLAAITYELVYGAPVPSANEVRAATGPLAGIDHVRLADLLERALASDPSARPSSGLSFAQALQQLIVPVHNLESHADFPIREPEPAGAVLVDDSSIREPEPEPPVPVPIPQSAAPVRHLAPVTAGVDDLPLRRVEPAPAAVSSRRADQKPARRPEYHPGSTGRDRSPESAAPLWFPISATLAIGLLMGFASGYVVGQRDATPAPRSAERAVARNQAPLAGERIDEDKPAATDGRDFTESTVPPAAPAAPRVAPRDEAEPTPRGTREEAAAFGVLQVESRPRGARVFVDGRLVGTTPMVLSEIRPGTHAVRIDLSGYRRWVTTVDVAPGERQRVAASLER